MRLFVGPLYALSAGTDVFSREEPRGPGVPTLGRESNDEGSEGSQAA